MTIIFRETSNTNKNKYKHDNEVINFHIYNGKWKALFWLMLINMPHLMILTAMADPVQTLTMILWP